jgi:nicotinate-nucleotide pyrophosphorylase (carboxylating)
VKFFTPNLKEYEQRIKERAWQALLDDVGEGDITSEAVIKGNKKVRARIIAKEDGILAGIFEVKAIFSKLGIKIEREHKTEGDEIKRGDLLLEIEGNAKDILKAERVALNFLMRASGIATETCKIVKKSASKIAVTRKTAPGLLFNDKRAASFGGGLTHRMGLFDGIIIKDNHISVVEHELGSRIKAIKECIQRAKEWREKNRTKVLIEIEVGNLREAKAAIEGRPDIIMLDNFKPDDIKKVVKLADGITLEASGRITEKNIHKFAKTGVDVLSLGSLTHSPRALDMSLEII